MGIDIERMVPDRLFDVFGGMECRKQMFQEPSLIKQRDESERISFGECFHYLVFDSFFGDILDQLMILLDAIPCLFLIIKQDNRFHMHNC